MQFVHCYLWGFCKKIMCDHVRPISLDSLSPVYDLHVCMLLIFLQFAQERFESVRSALIVDLDAHQASSLQAAFWCAVVCWLTHACFWEVSSRPHPKCRIIAQSHSTPDMSCNVWTKWMLMSKRSCVVLAYSRMYSLVQWNWFSDVTGCTWISSIQWRQRTNFTAPGCKCRIIYRHSTVCLWWQLVEAQRCIKRMQGTAAAVAAGANLENHGLFGDTIFPVLSLIAINGWL